MIRRTLPAILTLVSLSGCGADPGPLDWLTTRVGRILPVDAPARPAPTYTSEIPSVQTGQPLHADRAERPPAVEPPMQREVREEDWPVMIGCGLG